MAGHSHWNLYKQCAIVETDFDGFELLQGNRVKDDLPVVIGWFPAGANSPFAGMFEKASRLLHEKCSFYVAENAKDAKDSLAFREAGSTYVKQVTELASTDFDAFVKSISSKCKQLVQELTFQNAEELTEEGLDFFILFYDPEASDTLKSQFTRVVKESFMGEIDRINFLTANGRIFHHPLHHLGKNEKDLPLLASDSFKHMFLFNGNVQDALRTVDPIRQFIADHFSGKLHRDYHYPPPPPPPSTSTEDWPTPDKMRRPTQPLDSAFKKLKPSNYQYTVVHDEF